MIANPVTFGKPNDDFLQNLAEVVYENPPPEGVDLPLATISPKDKVWDNHRTQTQKVAQIYANNPQFEKYAKRMGDCASLLLFGLENGLTLKSAPFCHVRNCPTCQWRKSLRWKARMYEVYEQIKLQYPTHRWLFLTLTVENCPIGDLRQTLKSMNNAWKKLTKRKEFASVDGWIRTTEVTRDKKNPNTHAHPHFHCILMVKPSYFSHGYVKQMDWVRVWGDCMGANYLPNVDIRTVKPKGGDDTALKSAISETLKYAVKSADMIGDGSQSAQDWFFHYTEQVHRMHFVATGGALKNALKSDDKITDDEMISPTGETTETTDKRRLAFVYYPTKSSYIYTPKLNDYADKRGSVCVVSERATRPTRTHEHTSYG